MDKEYLQNNDRIYTTGCFLIYDKEKNSFKFDGLEGGNEYFDGNEVYFNPFGSPYVDRENN